MPRHQNNPKSKPVISKTYAELMAMVASSSLVVGQQYSTKIYTKYIQPKTGKLKIGVYDFYDATPEQIEEISEEIILTANSTSTFESIAKSMKYPGHELVYDIDNTDVRNQFSATTWEADADYTDIGGFYYDAGNYYRLRTRSSASALTSDTDVWAYLFNEGDVDRTGWIDRRIDKSKDPIKPVSWPLDYKQVLLPSFKLNYTTWNDSTQTSTPIESFTIGVTVGIAGQLYNYNDAIYLCIETVELANPEVYTDNFFRYWGGNTNYNSSMDGYVFSEQQRISYAEAFNIDDIELEIDYDSYQEVYPLGKYDEGSSTRIDVSDTCSNIYVGNTENLEICNFAILEATGTTDFSIINSADQSRINSISNSHGYSILRAYLGGQIINSNFEAIQTAYCKQTVVTTSKSSSSLLSRAPINNLIAEHNIDTILMFHYSSFDDVTLNGSANNLAFFQNVSKLYIEDGTSYCNFYCNVLDARIGKDFINSNVFNSFSHVRIGDNNGYNIYNGLYNVNLPDGVQAFTIPDISDKKEVKLDNANYLWNFYVDGTGAWVSELIIDRYGLQDGTYYELQDGFYELN